MDVDHPAVADARQALRGEDRPAALAALIKLLRSYEQPVDFGQKFRPDPRRRSPSAADALEGQYDFVGVKHTFDDRAEIDWDFNPTRVEGSPHAADPEWTQHLNRHVAWAGLAIMYRNSKEQGTIYAELFVKQFRSWVANKPMPRNGVARDANSAWLPMDVGLRLGSTWPVTWSIFREAEHVPDDVVLQMAKSIVEQARYLKSASYDDQRSRNIAMVGLIRAGALLPFVREAPAWREAARDMADEAFSQQLYPDGAHIELSHQNHIRMLGNLLSLQKTAEEGSFDLPNDFLRRIEPMYDFLLGSMRPDGTTPEWNDSTSVSLRAVFQAGLRQFAQRDDLRWLLSGSRAGRSPDFVSKVFPHAGQAYLRSGWAPGSLWLGFDAGPFGVGGTGHEDKLSITLQAFNRDLLIEAGTFVEDTSEWPDYVRSSAAHNVVLVDGLGQSRRKQTDTHRSREPDRLAFRVGEDVEYVRGQYTDGFGPEHARLATHQREILFLKERALFVVRDRLKPADDKEHRYDALFQLNAPAEDPSATVDSEALWAETRFANGPQLRVVGMKQPGLTIRLVTGADEPTLRSFLPHGEARREVRPIPTAVFGMQSDAAVEFVTVLQPLLPIPQPADPPAAPALPRVIEIRRTGADTYELLYDSTIRATADFGP